MIQGETCSFQNRNRFFSPQRYSCIHRSFPLHTELIPKFQIALEEGIRFLWLSKGCFFFFLLSDLRISKLLSSLENHMTCEHVPFLSSRSHLKQTYLLHAGSAHSPLQPSPPSEIFVFDISHKPWASWLPRLRWTIPSGLDHFMQPGSLLICKVWGQTVDESSHGGRNSRISKKKTKTCVVTAAHICCAPFLC